LFFRKDVNAKVQRKSPTDDNVGQNKDCLSGAAKQPSNQESGDFRREAVKAIPQFSHNQDLEGSKVHKYMDQTREMNNTNTDNTRVRHPKAGDIFVFNVDSIRITCLKVLAEDEFSWSSKLAGPCGGLRMKQFYYRPHDQGYSLLGQGEDHFRKTIYYREKDQTCLIHYRGDHEAAKPKLRYRRGQERLAFGILVKQRILEVDPNRKMSPTQILDKLKQSYPPEDLPLSKDQVRHYLKQVDKERSYCGQEDRENGVNHSEVIQQEDLSTKMQEVQSLEPPGDIEWVDLTPTFLEHLEEADLANNASLLLEPTCGEKDLANCAPSPLESMEEEDLADLATSNCAPSPLESTEEDDLADWALSFVECLEEEDLANYATTLLDPLEDIEWPDLLEVL